MSIERLESVAVSVALRYPLQSSLWLLFIAS